MLYDNKQYNHFGENFIYAGYIPDSKWITVVQTVASSTKRREWVRSTKQTPVVFLIGDDTGNGIDNLAYRLRDEMKKYKDILLIDVLEQYSGLKSSLSRKVWTGFSAIVKHSTSVQYIRKTDHDTWSEFSIMKKEVESLNKPIYYGKILRNKKVINNANSRNYSPFNNTVYPDFLFR